MWVIAQIVRESVQKHGGDSIIGKGYCKPVPEIEFYPSLSKGTGRFTDAYGFSIAVAEVQVDPQTARVKVLRVTIADDCGFGINPVNVEGQLMSQAVMGVGDALFEEIRLENGRITNPSFADYKLPGPFDIPEFNHVETCGIEPQGPFGAKEVGQGPLLPIMPAVANAVFDAIGVRIDEIPITPDKILRALAFKAAGKPARVGPDSFPDIPWPEPLKVTPPWEGGDGRASNPNATPTGRVVDAGIEAKAGIRAMKS